MAPKRSTSTKDVSEPKWKRKMMIISKKVKVLNMARKGKSYAAITRHCGVNKSTIRYIKKDEVNTRKTAATTVNTTAKRFVISRNKTIVRMEAALAL